MNSEVLILFSRKGCCLCEALEKKLSKISLNNLNPPIILSIIDIDNNEVSSDIKRKYTYEVPVLLLNSNKLLKKIELPRVPPRLKEELLLSWIQKNLDLLLKSS
tara:strand:- start:317 stop:628 length:312 start_codon:yes stop_codon:yes gene_type:complete